MATYVIGDIQGCFDTLTALLERMGFSPGRDRLLLAGDLVNRGPKSLEVLRWARSLEGSVVAVLGNHDLNLLATAAGVREPRRRDTIQPILEAPDREELLAWLAARPLAHREGDWLVVHAGLHPSWTADEAVAEARLVEAAIADGSWLEAWNRRPTPPAWSRELQGIERVAAALPILVSVRTVRPDLSLDTKFAGPPGAAPLGNRPWFEAGLADPGATVAFGHWAALGLHLGARHICLDTGCVWGGQLTALRLEDRAVFQQLAVERRQ